MLETGTSGLMSGEGKPPAASRSRSSALPRLYLSMATLTPGRRVVAAMLANGVSSSCLRQDGRRPAPVRPARMAQGLRWCLWASRLFNSAGFRNKRAIPAGRCDRSEKTSYRILTVPTRAGGSRIFGRRHPTVKGTAMKADSRNSPTAVLFANSLRTRNIPRIRRLASLLQSCGPARILSDAGFRFDLKP